MNWVTLPIASLLVAPALFGQVIFLATAINILTTVGTFGQQRTLLHYSSKSQRDSYGALLIALLFAAIIVPSAYLGIRLFQDVTPLTSAIVSFLMILHALLSTQCRAFEDVKNFAYLRISLSGSRLALVVSALAFSDSISHYLLAELVAICLSLIMRIHLLKKILNQPKEISFSSLKRSGQIGTPVFIQSILFMIVLNYDKLIFGRMQMFDQLGQYGLLFLISSSISFITAYIGIRFEPSVYQSECIQGSYSITKAYHRNLLVTQTLAGFAITLVWQFVGPIAQPNNTLPWYILPLLFIGQLLAQSTIPWSSFLTRANAFWAQTVSATVAALISISMNTLLIPTFGAAGASATSIASNLAYFLLLFIYSHGILRQEKK